MALLDDVGKAATPGNLMLGVGAALLAPVLAPVVSSVIRPAAKAVMRTGITLYRSAMEPISAGVGNLVAEAQMELAASSGPAAAPQASPEPGAGSSHKPRQSKQRGGTSQTGSEDRRAT